jgi:hypothetical protein
MRKGVYRTWRQVEADGSVKVYIGSEAPVGYKRNWVQSNPGEGFFTYLRLYGPTEAYFDKSWKIPDYKKNRVFR